MLLRGQSPQDVAEVLSDAALQDLLGYKTKWKVKITTYGDHVMTGMILNNLKKREEEAAKEGASQQATAIGLQSEALKKAPLTEDSETH